MTTLDIKQVEPLIKELSLPEEVKKAFYQTFFGSLMGQAFLFMGLLAIYLQLLQCLTRMRRPRCRFSVTTSACSSGPSWRRRSPASCCSKCCQPRCAHYAS